MNHKSKFLQRLLILAQSVLLICVPVISHAKSNSSVTVEGFDLTHCGPEFCYKLYAPEAFQGVLSPIYVFNSGHLKVFKRNSDQSLQLIREENGADGGYFNPLTSKIVLRNIAVLDEKKKNKNVHDAILYMDSHKLMYY